MKVLFYYLIGYLIGSFNFGIIVPKIKCNEDIRQYGSGNAGATNAYRVFGKVIGIIVLLLDSLKAFSYLQLLKECFHVNDRLMLVIVGIFVIFGHLFPLWFKFRGGKGVSSSLGILAAVCPEALLILIPCFIISAIISMNIGIASVIVSIIMPFTVYAFLNESMLIKSKIVSACFIISFLVIASHRENIKEKINH